MNSISFTVDVEDGISLAMRDYYKQEVPISDRVVDNTKFILRCLEESGQNATFFILGNVAKAFPELIKEIALKKHEIGVHGFNHFKFTDITPTKAFSEISSAKKLIEDISGQEVYGHRAPEFSVDTTNMWAFKIVQEAGFLYDSSVKPMVFRSVDGFPGDKNIYHVPDSLIDNKLIIYSLSKFDIMNYEFPFCGGRYFQYLPYWYIKRIYNKILKSQPGVFYIHPYEIDTKPYPDYYMQHVKSMPLKKRAQRQLRIFGKKNNPDKMARLLQDFKVCSMIENIRNSNCLKTNASTV